MVKWTCCGCGDEYTEQSGDTDERMCDECLNHENDYGPPYSMANPTGVKQIRDDKTKLIKLIKKLGWDYYRLSSSGKETYDKITDILETKNV